MKPLYHGTIYEFDEEYIMDVADASAASTDLRFTHDEVFGSIREKINA